MKLSISLTAYPGADIGTRLDELAVAADASGVDTVWVSDHLLQADPGLAPGDPMLEAYSTLSYLAGRTSRVRLGAMVSPVTYRPPALLIKAVTTLDVLSRGRAWLGIGAGYQGDEARAMGLDLPPVHARFERLEETLLLAGRMWADDASPFQGRHYRLEHPIGRPLPASPPPLLIGGAGERRTLPLVATYAAACNLFDIPDGGTTLRRKLDLLDRLCEERGRDPRSLERTVSTRWGAGVSAAQAVEDWSRLRRLGVDHLVVIRPGPWTADDVEKLMAAARI